MVPGEINTIIKALTFVFVYHGRSLKINKGETLG